MANNYGHFPLSSLRKSTGVLLKSKYGNKASVFGNGWKNPDGNLNGNQKGESQFYSGSKIGINVSNFNVDRYSSDRIFRIIASGCFCLSHHYIGIEKDFKVGEEVETFISPIEMCNKIEYYLQNPEERALIQQQGYRLAHEKFEYRNMVENIIEIYNKYK
jgi:spore maturation protein CgeB